MENGDKFIDDLICSLWLQINCLFCSSIIFTLRKINDVNFENLCFISLLSNRMPKSVLRRYLIFFRDVYFAIDRSIPEKSCFSSMNLQKELQFTSLPMPLDSVLFDSRMHTNSESDYATSRRQKASSLYWSAIYSIFILSLSGAHLAFVYNFLLTSLAKVNMCG